MTETDERIQALQRELADLRAEVCRIGDAADPKHRRVSRGHLLRSAGIAAAGAAAAAVAGPAVAPALAANGDSVTAGQTTTATAATSLSGSVLTDAALRVSNYYSGSFDDYSDALQGYTFGAGLAGIYGRNDAAGGAGVIGYSSGGYGASFGGGLAPLQLQPAASAGPPTTANHQQGELYLDSAGTLWICTASGTSSTPGTFKQVATGSGVPSPVGMMSRIHNSQSAVQNGWVKVAWDEHPWASSGISQNADGTVTGLAAGVYLLNISIISADTHGSNRNVRLTDGTNTIWTFGDDPGSGSSVTLAFLLAVSIGAGLTLEVDYYTDSYAPSGEIAIGSYWSMVKIGG